LPPLIPKGSRLTLYRWQRTPNGPDLHARYILTENGGVRFDHGLDEGRHSDDTTDIALLDHQENLSCRRQFERDRSPYDLVDQFRVDGNKP